MVVTVREVRKAIPLASEYGNQSRRVVNGTCAQQQQSQEKSKEGKHVSVNVCHVEQLMGGVCSCTSQ